jgi:hypothetical protein
VSRNTHVFVRTENTLDELADHLGYLFNQQLEFGEDEHERWYLYVTDYNVIDLMDNAMVNDRGIPFEDYHYDIRIRVKRIPGISGEASERYRLADATKIFEALKSTGIYSVMLVDNVDVLLAEHIIE